MALFKIKIRVNMTDNAIVRAARKKAKHGNADRIGVICKGCGRVYADTSRIAMPKIADVCGECPTNKDGKVVIKGPGRPYKM